MESTATQRIEWRQQGFAQRRMPNWRNEAGLLRNNDPRGACIRLEGSGPLCVFARPDRNMDNFDMESAWFTRTGEERGDEYTLKILEFVQALEKSSPEPFIPLLADLALARVLIVHLTLRYGPERGPEEARIAFETTLAQLKPILERYYREKGTPTR